MELKLGPKNTSLEFFPAYALKFLNIPYIYGGKSPLIGLDCSGIACEFMQALGVIPNNSEMGSQQIFDYLKDRSSLNEISVGSLAFYGLNTSRIDHVAIFLDTNLIIEAGHGDHTTLTLVDAQKRDAKVRVRPFNYRKDLVAILRPKYEELGFHD